MQSDRENLIVKLQMNIEELIKENENLRKEKEVIALMHNLKIIHKLATYIHVGIDLSLIQTVR